MPERRRRRSHRDSPRTAVVAVQQPDQAREEPLDKMEDPLDKMNSDPGLPSVHAMLSEPMLVYRTDWGPLLVEEPAAAESTAASPEKVVVRVEAELAEPGGGGEEVEALVRAAEDTSTSSSPDVERCAI